jgi:pilus assembly protein CpaE
MTVFTAALAVQSKVLEEELRAAAEGLPLHISVDRFDLNDSNGAAESRARTPVEILFLETTKVPDLEGLLRELRAAPNPPAVFAVSHEANSTAILEALRAGVSEFLVPPFRAPLIQALDRISTNRPAIRPPKRTGGKILGFLSSKGGCGATTLVSHVARDLPQQTSSKALLVDFDFDAGLLSFLFKTKSSYSLLDAAENLHRLDSSYWKAVVSNGIPGLEIIGSTLNANHDVLTPEVIKEMFRFFRTEYDWILVDLGRGLNPFRLSVLEQCDEACVVTTAEIVALHHCQKIVTRILENGFTMSNLRVILNRPPKDFDITVQELEKMLGAKIYGPITNDYDTLNESYAAGSLAPSNSLFGKAVSELARRIAGLQSEKSKKWFSLLR